MILSIYQLFIMVYAFIFIERFSHVIVCAAGGLTILMITSLQQVFESTQAEKELNAYIYKHFPEWEFKLFNSISKGLYLNE